MPKDNNIRILTDMEIRGFQALVYDYYNDHKRDSPWRNTVNPYHIVVSEIMLQQTQTDRVYKKYEEFLGVFPTLESLAQAPLDRVIAAWQGLGYNRRALALKQLSERIMIEFQGAIPPDPEMLKATRSRPRRCSSGRILRSRSYPARCTYHQLRRKRGYR